jgi:2-dehydropantoate 2-reductase
VSDPVLIVGTGAMACLFAARLAAAGVQVTMLGTWVEGLEALRLHGVRLVEADGQDRVLPVRAGSEPAEFAGMRFALVLVKSWQTERAARQLAACLASDGVALTLQNGLGNREILVEALQDERVALGVTTLGATLLGPGQVQPGGEGTISIGAHPRLPSFINMFQKAGIPVEVLLEISDLLWSKLVINAAINPLTALLHIPNGELLARPSARLLMGAAACEAAEVADAIGRNLTFSDPLAAVEAVASHTAMNHSSMLQDVQRGALTEIDAICGEIVAAGERSGIPTPVNRTLWLLIKGLNGG